MTAISPDPAVEFAAELGRSGVTEHDDSSTRRYRDPKKYLWTIGLVVPLLPLGAHRWAQGTGLDAMYWMGPLWILVLMPILDTLLGTDQSNPPDWAVPQLEASRWYRVLTWLYVPLQYAGLVFACHVVVNNDLSWFAWLGYALTVGTVAGVAINTAHELGHKRAGLERRLSKVALAQTGYGHFYVEHNRGHHARVSTPEDPASARMGESLWEFLPRTVIGSLRSAWELETGRLARKGLRWWSPRNDILNAWALSVVLFAALVVAFGPAVVPFLVVQAVFGFCLLEVVNYIEHYGLLRQRVANGRYEKCQPVHSWNSNNIASNLALYHLERHSDHHANPTRRFQALRHFPDSPQLPSGYALMITIAAVPPLWRRVMDHRVLDHYEGDITRANIHPRQRERILARYAA
ncbi:MAG: alkane 1-monooxygenase [Microthrixaceae bacterium]|jgi:alkane 1-monooxygenase|nr:alkane 1-monooxygenase [Microthrixaceae bacterium]